MDRVKQGVRSTYPAVTKCWSSQNLLPFLLAICVLLVGLATSAQASTGSQQRAVHTVTPATIPYLKQLTNVNPSSIVAKNVCGAPSPGQASCAAEVLINNVTGQAIHPKVSVAPKSTSIFAPLGANITSEPSAAAPPPAGTPAYFLQAYDLTALSATAGTGETVAIVDAYGYANAESDLATYREEYGLSACTTGNGCFRKVDQNGGTSYPGADPNPDPYASWSLETMLDLEAVSAICPNCHILLVEANDRHYSNLIAAEYQASTLGANQISNSWVGISKLSSSDFVFPGVATVAASGDEGYTNQAEYPAALGGVNAAGGTTLLGTGPGVSARGWKENVWTGTGSGCSPVSKPAWQTDTSCTTRSYNDISAVADPNTGLDTYGSEVGEVFVGGTSLSTPMIAAYYALLGGAGAAGGQWASDNASFLNDITSGSNSGQSCVSFLYICNAGVGYDGPTGFGSISGAVAAGAPGIGGPGLSDTYASNVTFNSADLSGGIYPNQHDTSYWWEYGTSSSYGQSTTPQDVGSGSAPVATADTLSSLTLGTKYYYRLVAQNSSGTTYGYGYDFTTPIPDPPVCLPLNASMFKNAVLGVGLNCTGFTFTYSIVGAPSHGSLGTIDQNSGQVNYSPTLGYVGPDSFTYKATNVNGDSNIVSVSLTVNPLAPACATVSVTMTESTRTTVALSCSGESFTYAIISGPKHGFASGVSQSNGLVSYTPDSGYVGPDSFTYKATNAGGGSNVATANITVNPPVPSCIAVSAATPEGEATNVSLSCSGESFRYAIVSGPAHGSVGGLNQNNGQIVYTPAAGSAGRDSFTYKATNAGGDSIIAAAAIVVYSPPNISLQANGDANQLLLGYGTPLTLSWTATGATSCTALDGWGGPELPNSTQLLGALTQTTTYTLACTGPGGNGSASITIRVKTYCETSPNAVSCTPRNTVPPSVKGKTRRGMKLTATRGTWQSATPISYTYQWKSCSRKAKSCQTIRGAKRSAFTVGARYVGRRLEVVVTATNANGKTTRASKATSVISPSNYVNWLKRAITPKTVSAAIRKTTSITSAGDRWWSSCMDISSSSIPVGVAGRDPRL